MTTKVREQAVLLGPRKSLLCIVSQCAPAHASSGKPAIVILNAGIIHRVGPNRMFVGLARTLADAGHLVVRFDLSGIGDSDPREDQLQPLEAALADIREVLDALGETRDVRKFILVGLCSGANHAVAYGGDDPRIAGVVLIDPSIPRTKRYYFNHYRPRLFRLKSWLNFASGRHPFWPWVSRLFGRRPAELMEDPQSSLQRAEVRAFLERAYLRATASGLEFLAVFTGGLEYQHNYREQLLEAFPKVKFGSHLQLEYFPQSDHTFSAQADRAALMGLIAAWVEKHSAGN